jgi:superfamily I DNA/RNA helicase
MAYKLIRKKRACKVLGRKIGTGLISLVKKMNAANVDDLIDRLEVYVEREVLKFEAKGKEQQAQAVRDRVDTVNIFIEQLTEDNRTIDGLIQAISDLFADSNVGMITLSTIHRAKGREWDRVFILDPQLMPSPWARQEWQQKQEKNIQFVAVTRAKKELAYIKLDNWQDKLEAEKEKAAI